MDHRKNQRQWIIVKWKMDHYELKKLFITVIDQLIPHPYKTLPHT